VLRPAQERAPAVIPPGSPAPSAAARATPNADPARDRFWSVTVREVTPDAVFPGSLVTPTHPHQPSRDLFSPADPDVEPATLVRPQMPSPRPPSGPDQRDSVFDLIIDQNGRVEQVRLVSPANRFNDRMLIAAAKAWQFLPATKDGQPVRYKLQVRIAP
jgi:TonB family protein